MDVFWDFQFRFHLEIVLMLSLLFLSELHILLNCMSQNSGLLHILMLDFLIYFSRDWSPKVGSCLPFFESNLLTIFPEPTIDPQISLSLGIDDFCKGVAEGDPSSGLDNVLDVLGQKYIH